MGKRYQQGTLELVKTAAGPTWYIRFRISDKDRPRYRIGTKADFPSESKASRAAQHLRDTFNALPEALAARTFSDLIARYTREEMPPRFSTAQTYQGMLSKHIGPRWGAVPLAEMRPMDVRAWLDGLDLSSRTKGHIRDLMRVLFRFAMLWEWMPAAVNPMTLFRMKGATRRQQKPKSLTHAEFATLLKAIPGQPTRTMILVAACLGLRCSEIGALRWGDMDWLGGLIHVRRAIVQGHVDDVKTEASHKALPLHPSLARVLRDYRAASDFKRDEDYVFASPHQGGEKPYAMKMLQLRIIRPAGIASGLGDGIGWHTFRHSYRSWLRAAGASPEEQRDLMRHTDITTTLNVYGDIFDEPLRVANDAVVKEVLQ